MNRTHVKLLLAALCLTTACDPTSQKAPAQVSDELAAPAKAPGDGGTAYKWSARPPSGVNGPWRY